jgi:hypothetical protein
MQQLIEHPNFLMARLMDQEFDEKQNNDSLQMCEIFGWPHEHLPKISNGVVHIKAYDTEFNSDQGEQRAIQIKLRKLLFGQSFHTEDLTFTQLSEFAH